MIYDLSTFNKAHILRLSRRTALCIHTRRDDTQVSNSRSLILYSSKLSGIIQPTVVDFHFDVASRRTQYHKMFTKKWINRPSLVCVYSHNGNCCFLDESNWFTYIEKGEELPGKGKSKQLRYDKNLISVGLAVSEDNVPFMHETYEGNMHDSKIFPRLLDTLTERLNNLKIPLDKYKYLYTSQIILPSESREIYYGVAKSVLRGLMFW